MTRILTLTGASGSGKSTIAKEILKSPAFSLIVSFTTRGTRPTDLNGEYKCISTDEFLKLKSRGHFLWTMKLRGDNYGTLKYSIDLALESHTKTSVMILIPEVLKILSDYVGHENVLSLFITTPTQTIWERLTHGLQVQRTALELAEMKAYNSGDEKLAVEIQNQMAELEARMGEKRTEIEKRLNDQKNWEEETRKVGVPYKVIPNDGTLDETMAKIRPLISYAS